MDPGLMPQLCGEACFKKSPTVVPIGEPAHDVGCLSRQSKLSPLRKNAVLNLRMEGDGLMVNLEHFVGDQAAGQVP